MLTLLLGLDMLVACHLWQFGLEPSGIARFGEFDAFVANTRCDLADEVSSRWHDGLVA